jgi:hypothetical protein
VLPERQTEKVEPRERYIRPELADVALASEHDRLGLANKGADGG